MHASVHRKFEQAEIGHDCNRDRGHVGELGETSDCFLRRRASVFRRCWQRFTHASSAFRGNEVKAAFTVPPRDVKHIQGLRDKLGDRFTAGVMLYLGDRVVPLGERIWALPVSMLWAD